MNHVTETWILVFTVGIIGWWLWWKKDKLMSIKRVNLNEKGEDIASKIPKGCQGWPLIGETLEFIASGCSSRPVSFMEKRKSLYGKVFKSHLLGIPVIVSTDPDVNKVILQNNGNAFIPYYPKSIKELLGKTSILQMNGALQRRVHGLIGSFLKSPQLKVRLTKEIETCVGLFMDSWTDRKTPIYIQEEYRNITFQILVKVLMGIGPGEELEFLKNEFGEFIKGLICIPIKFPGTRLRKSLKAKERLLKMVRGIVEKKKQKMDKASDHDHDHDDKKSGAIAWDAIDVLLADAGESDIEIQRLPVDFISGNIVEMMIPGEDSVPMVTTLAVKFLSDSPLALNHLREENMELKRNKDSSGEEYEWTDYMALPFTQNVISETLRMANIINAIWRKALKDVEIKGYLIPEGWCVLASLSAVHMAEENYENPYQFDPWRWQNKGGRGMNTSIFTPFGGGHRLCPGMEFARLEVAIFLHHLVTRFRWEAEEDYIVNFPTVKMKRKLPVTVTPLSP